MFCLAGPMGMQPVNGMMYGQPQGYNPAMMGMNPYGGMPLQVNLYEYAECGTSQQIKVVHVAY